MPWGQHADGHQQPCDELCNVVWLNHSVRYRGSGSETGVFLWEIDDPIDNEATAEMYLDVP